MNPLAPFSDWVLALLPRLFVYPGGVWAGAALLVFAWVVSPKSQGSGVRGRGLGIGGRGSGYPAFGLLPAASVAWAALALLPLPGATLLPFPADRLSLVGMLLISAALDHQSERQTYYALANGAISLVVLAPLASGQTLIRTGANWGVFGWLSLAATIVGIFALSSAGHSTANNLRALGWFGLAAAPLWTLTPSIPAAAWVSIVYVVFIATLAILSRVPYIREHRAPVLSICWALAALSLFAALLTT